jgi:inorganic pyrophosphatase
MTILSELLTQILIPVAAVVGIAFALLQWLIVSRISVSPSASAKPASSSSDNGRGDYLLEDPSHDDREVVAKCAEIQEAISLGTLLSLCVFLLEAVTVCACLCEKERE